MAASDAELLDARAPPPPPPPPPPHRANGSAAVEERAAASVEPYNPHDPDHQPLPLSQVTLPSTEMPGSPIDPASSFKTEVHDDLPGVTVIPSSLTPPPSTQVGPPTDGDGNPAGRVFASSQRSVLFSPPATILNTMRDREAGSEYAPPTPRQVRDAPADELRALLQTCIAEHQKLKMEAAHHKLQFNLLSLQADEESKRAAVEHDMVRRQVDALRMAEHSRQARRELSGPSESLQSKYLQVKAWYEAAMEDNETLRRRLKVAKKVIQQKEEETVGLAEERDLLVTRIRENREHFRMLCSPGGIFHGALTPRQMNLTPQQLRATPRATPRALRREESNTREHGLSALLEAMNQSQDSSSNTHNMNNNNNNTSSASNNTNNNNSYTNYNSATTISNNNNNNNNNISINNSAPTTPMVMVRPAPRTTGGRHHRNAQSMSALPTTPMNRPPRDQGGLLPSVHLVAQTEPRPRASQRRYALDPSTPPLRRPSQRKSRESTISAEDTEELARQAVESVKAVRQLAAEQDVLRRLASDGGSGPAEEVSAAMQAKLFPGGEKRKYSGEGGEPGHAAGSYKKGRPGDSPRVGLGIQYRR